MTARVLVGKVIAHSLAKFDLISIDSVWIEENPPCIASDVAMDKRHEIELEVIPKMMHNHSP
jgi:hypothetical protein